MCVCDARFSIWFVVFFFVVFVIWYIHQEKRRDENRRNSTFQAYSRVLASEIGVFVVNTKYRVRFWKRLKRLCGLLLLTFWYVHLEIVRRFCATQRNLWFIFSEPFSNGFSFLFSFLLQCCRFTHTAAEHFKATGITDLFLVLSLIYSFWSICVRMSAHSTIYCLKPFKGISTFNKC